MTTAVLYAPLCRNLGWSPPSKKRMEANPFCKRSKHRKYKLLQQTFKFQNSIVDEASLSVIEVQFRGGAAAGMGLPGGGHREEEARAGRGQVEGHLSASARSTTIFRGLEES